MLRFSASVRSFSDAALRSSIRLISDLSARYPRCERTDFTKLYIVNAARASVTGRAIIGIPAPGVDIQVVKEYVATAERMPPAPQTNLLLRVRDGQQDLGMTP